MALAEEMRLERCETVVARWRWVQVEAEMVKDLGGDVSEHGGDATEGRRGCRKMQAEEIKS